jgi:BASS family bile acid:Na+ symporter
MTLATLLPLVLKLSIAGTVLSVALDFRRQDVTYLFRDPGKFARSFLSIFVIMPVVALALAAVLDLHPAVRVALLGLALSPVPPMLPGKELRAGGRGSYVVGLLFATALLSIAIVPVGVHLAGEAIGIPRALGARAVGGIVLASVLAPLVVGVAIRSLWPVAAERVARPVGVLATVLLAACCLPLLPSLAGAMGPLIGNGTLLAIIVFAAVGLTVGHLLGGPGREDRVVLALSTAGRHPMVAIAVAMALFPGHREVVPAVLLYLFVAGVVSALYIKRAGSRAGKESGPVPGDARARSV